MLSTGVTSTLKNILPMRNKLNEVANTADQLAVCPMLFFFKSSAIPGAADDGHEDIYRSFCGNGKSLNDCYDASGTNGQHDILPQTLIASLNDKCDLNKTYFKFTKKDCESTSALV
jgi:hypothetical protein